MEEKFMDCYNNSNCSPDKCGGCPGCGGEAIEKITIKVEWKHKGQTPEDADGINEIMTELSGELMVSGVELVYINNSFGVKSDTVSSVSSSDGPFNISNSSFIK